MIVDSSAIVALLRKEAGFERLKEALLRAEPPVAMASPNYVEASIVIDAKGSAEGSRTLDDLIAEYEIEVIPFTAEHARLAREAYRDFGRGSGHPAKLNFGDAMAYAVAKAERQSLLFVGNDFIHTDIDPA